MDIFWGFEVLYTVGFSIQSELYNSVSFLRWCTTCLFSLASPFIYTPMSFWQSYSPRLIRRALTLKICTEYEVGVKLPAKTYRFYGKHVFITFYFSPFERCSVYSNKNTLVTGHKSDFYCATTDKVKPVLVSRQQYVISRSTLTFLSLSDSSGAENSVLLGHFDHSSWCHYVSSKRRERITDWRGMMSQRNRILSHTTAKIAKPFEFSYFPRPALSHLPERVQQQ
jgi:hypothetical protein